jgi:hypothetical protein
MVVTLKRGEDERAWRDFRRRHGLEGTFTPNTLALRRLLGFEVEVGVMRRRVRDALIRRLYPAAMNRVQLEADERELLQAIWGGSA